MSSSVPHAKEEIPETMELLVSILRDRQEHFEFVWKTWLRLIGLAMSLRFSALKHFVPGFVSALNLKASAKYFNWFVVQ